jgi:hypothetical protein
MGASLRIGIVPGIGRGVHRVDCLAGREDRFDRLAKKLRDAESQGEAGIVLFRLDGVNGLTRDVKALGEVRLGPASLGAEDSKPALHS